MDEPYLLFFLAEATETVEFPSLFSSLLNALLVLALIVGNGFFVASEFALVAVRKSRIEALANDGNRGAGRLLGILDNLNAYISATQLGITLFSLGLGYVAEPAVVRVIEPLFAWVASASNVGFLASPTLVHTLAFAVSFSLITFLLIVFGELAPKMFALEMSEKYAVWVSLPLQLFYKALYYPIRILNWAGNSTVRLFGLKPSEDQDSIYTEDEIRQLVRISQESGHLNEEESNLINQVFEFSETTVKEAMIPRTEIVALSVLTPLNEIAETFRECGFSRLPVFRESMDDIAGVIHSKDIMISLLTPDNFRIEKILRKPVYVVDTARLEDVLRRMQKEQFHFGFVVDEHGGVEGIITLEDLLEEIVGEIADEYDEEVAEQISAIDDGSYLLDGGIAVRDVNRELDLELPVSESYTTIAGFLMSEAGRVLKQGDEIPFNGHKFIVEHVERRRVLSVRMVKN